MKLIEMMALKREIKRFLKTFHPNVSRLNVEEFFCSSNLYDNCGLQTMYVAMNKKSSCYIDLVDMERACTAFSELIKEELVFYRNELPYISLNDSIRVYPCQSFEDWKNNIMVHTSQPFYVEMKEVKKSKQNINQDFAKNSDNLGIDTHNKTIVSIDFEFYSYHCHSPNFRSCSEVGITTKFNNTVTHQHFLITNTIRKKQRRVYLQDNFNFGESLHVSAEEVKGIIADALEKADFLLFHDMASELSILKANGFSFESIQVLDTQRMSRHLYKDKKVNKPLNELLLAHNIDYSYLHNSGNDAAYTLQLFLKMSENYEKIAA